jgi:glyoxylase-like metal-dependent hydrolase (beta-lactamase superfamily II)
VEVVALIDTLQTYPGTAIYPSAGDALQPFGAYMDANGGVELNFASFVLIDGDTTVLVDTGWGPEFQGQLPTELEAAGLRVTDIDVITYTHLHGDHTGWNFDRATGQPLFPTARYLVPKGDFEHYRAQEPRPGSFERDIAPLDALGRCELIEGETRLSPSLVTLPTPGHTPGHTSIVIQSGGERGFILGDVVISMIDAEVPSLDTAFDWDHAIARRTREAIIARLAGDRSLVGASHLPAPGFGRFEADGAQSRWVRA